MDRKSFLRISQYALLIPIIYLIENMVRQNEHSRPIDSKIIFKKNITEGITLFEDVILYVNKDKIQLYVNRCTHAGCRITHSEGEVLICACHGSRFQIRDGKVVQGPALKSLEHIKYTIDKETGNIRY